MTAKKKTIWILAISILCAIAIVVSSALIVDSDLRQMVTYGLIALWFVPFSILSAAQRCKACSPQSDQNIEP